MCDQCNNKFNNSFALSRHKALHCVVYFNVHRNASADNVTNNSSYQKVLDDMKLVDHSNVFAQKEIPSRKINSDLLEKEKPDDVFNEKDSGKAFNAVSQKNPINDQKSKEKESELSHLRKQNSSFEVHNCNLCGSEFYYIAALKKHQSLYCKIFNTQKNLTEIESEKNLVCNNCGKNFINVSELVIHQSQYCKKASVQKEDARCKINNNKFRDDPDKTNEKIPNTLLNKNLERSALKPVEMDSDKPKDIYLIVKECDHCAHCKPLEIKNNEDLSLKLKRKRTCDQSNSVFLNGPALTIHKRIKCKSNISSEIRKSNESQKNDSSMSKSETKQGKMALQNSEKEQSNNSATSAKARHGSESSKGSETKSKKRISVSADDKVFEIKETTCDQCGCQFDYKFALNRHKSLYCKVFDVKKNTDLKKELEKNIAFDISSNKNKEKGSNDKKSNTTENITKNVTSGTKTNNAKARVNTTKGVVKEVVCSLCGNKFKNNSDLTTHKALYCKLYGAQKKLLASKYLESNKNNTTVHNNEHDCEEKVSESTLPIKCDKLQKSATLVKDSQFSNLKIKVVITGEDPNLNQYTGQKGRAKNMRLEINTNQPMVKEISNSKEVDRSSNRLSRNKENLINIRIQEHVSNDKDTYVKGCSLEKNTSVCANIIQDKQVFKETKQEILVAQEKHIDIFAEKDKQSNIKMQKEILFGNEQNQTLLDRKHDVTSLNTKTQKSSQNTILDQSYSAKLSAGTDTQKSKQIILKKDALIKKHEESKPDIINTTRLTNETNVPSLKTSNADAFFSPSIFCEKCGKSLRNTTELESPPCGHKKTRFLCSVCKVLPTSVNSLISHQRLHHNTDEMLLHEISAERTSLSVCRYYCYQCGEGFNYINNLICHKVDKHRFYQENSVSKVSKPIIKAAKPEHRLYACTICNGKRFASLETLIDHEKGSAKHKQKVALNQHVKPNRDPLPTTEFDHVCYICNLGFRSFRGQQKHMLQSSRHYALERSAQIKHKELKHSGRANTSNIVRIKNTKKPSVQPYVGQPVSKVRVPPLSYQPYQGGLLNTLPLNLNYRPPYVNALSLGQVFLGLNSLLHQPAILKQSNSMLCGQNRTSGYPSYLGQNYASAPRAPTENNPYHIGNTAQNVYSLHSPSAQTPNQFQSTQNSCSTSIGYQSFGSSELTSSVYAPLETSIEHQTKDATAVASQIEESFKRPLVSYKDLDTVVSLDKKTREKNYEDIEPPKIVLEASNSSDEEDKLLEDLLNMCFVCGDTFSSHDEFDKHNCSGPF